MVGYKKFGKKFYIISIICVALLILALVISYFLGLLKSITYFSTDKSISIATRISSIIANVKVMFLNISNFIFGTGVSDYLVDMKVCLQNLVSEGGSTSTLFINFAMHGVFYGGILLFAFGGIVWLLSNKDWKFVVPVGGFLFFSLLSQTMIYNSIYYIISLYGAVYLIRKIKEKIEDRSKNNENIVDMQCDDA